MNSVGQLRSVNMLVNVGDSEVSKVSRLQRILNDILRWFDIDETNDHRLWV